MIKKIETIFKFAIIGVGFGGITYTLLLLMTHAQTQSVAQIATVMWISALIGLVSMIFIWDRLSLLAGLSLHFCLVYALVALMTLLNKITNPFTLPFLATFLLVYVTIWCLSSLSFANRTNRINQVLEEKKKSHSNKP